MTTIHDTGTWVLDLDGVLWLSGEAIEGSTAAVARLRAAGRPVLFVTNNSAPTVAELQDRLGRIGVEAASDEIVTAAQGAASLVPEGATVLCIADGGVREALAERGVEVIHDGVADVVIVGWTEHFDYDVLAKASAAVRAGGRLIGTNADPTHPTPTGLRPGTGAILAAVEVASGVTATYAGKPNEALRSLVASRGAEVAVVVGDQDATDGRFADLLGVPFGLVLSGVTRSPIDGRHCFANLAHVVEAWL